MNNLNETEIEEFSRFLNNVSDDNFMLSVKSGNTITALPVAGAYDDASLNPQVPGRHPLLSAAALVDECVADLRAGKKPAGEAMMIALELAQNPDVPQGCVYELLELFGRGAGPIGENLALNPSLSADQYEALACSRDDAVRMNLAGNPSVPVDILIRFLAGGSRTLAFAVLDNPACTERMAALFADPLVLESYNLTTANVLFLIRDARTAVDFATLPAWEGNARLEEALAMNLFTPATIVMPLLDQRSTVAGAIATDNLVNFRYEWQSESAQEAEQH